MSTVWVPLKSSDVHLMFEGHFEGDGFEGDVTCINPKLERQPSSLYICALAAISLNSTLIKACLV